MGVRAKTTGVNSLLPCGFLESNSGHQVGQRSPLPTPRSKSKDAFTISTSKHEELVSVSVS